MTDNDQLLDKIGNLIDKKLKPVKKDLQEVKQSQVQTNTTLGQIATAVESIRAGQEDIREKMATKADIHDLKVDLVKKIKSHESRLDSLEEHTNTPNPHKN